MRKLVLDNARVARWTRPCVRKYRRYYRELKITGGILIKQEGSLEVPVVPFDFLVDIVVKIHQKLVHVGAVKVLYFLKQHFWHHALSKVIKDACYTCSH